MVKNLVFIDTETTGLNHNWHEIIDIWYTVTSPNGEDILEEYGGKTIPIYPERMDCKAREINGYDPDDWLDARPTIDVLMDCVNAILSNKCVGQNPMFDVRFIREALWRSNQFKLADRISKIPLIDTKNLARESDFNFPNFKLDTMCDFLDIKIEGRAHTAKADVYRTIELYKRLLQF